MKLIVTKIQWAVVGALICLPVAIHIIAIDQWANLNSPKGKFSTFSEYLASQRPPQRVAMVVTPDATNYVAYGSLAGSRLAVPSGPPAYVFDASGSLIYYSVDIGDDSSFHQRWPAAAQKAVSREGIHALGFQQSAAPTAAPPHR